MIDFFKKFTKKAPAEESMLLGPAKKGSALAGTGTATGKTNTKPLDDSVEYRFTDTLQNQTEILQKNQELKLKIKFSVYNGANLQTLGTSGNSLVVYESAENDVRLFGVLNPHGLSGKEISSVLVAFIQNYMNENIKKLEKLKGHPEIERFLSSMIQKSDNELNKNGIDLNFSGTTLTLLLVTKGVVYSASLGNSKAVLFRKITDEKKYAIELTVEHTPENRDERYRIFQNGGIVQKVKVGEEEVGPLRIWDGKIENGPGLQITRSLGDSKATKLGVLSEPEIQHFELRVWDKFVVIATENVWQMLPSTRMCYHVSKFLAERPQEIAKISKFLAKKVQQRWQQMLETNQVSAKIDRESFDPEDIAILVFTLSPMN